jgi:aspartate-semialdehyde dehydrogenase
MPESLWSPPLNSQDAGPCQAPIFPVVDRKTGPARNRPNQETKAHHDDRRFSDAFRPDCPRNRRPGLPFRHFHKTGKKNRLASSPASSLSGVVAETPYAESGALKELQSGRIRDQVKETSMGYKVAVVGATGNVGREMLNILAEREFPVDECFAIASRKSMGVEVSFGDKTLKCKDLEQFDFSQVDFVLMSAGSAVSKEWSPKIGALGAIVIDNSSCWRYDAEVPLVVPEVNAHVLVEYMARNKRRNIIANPNCSTAQLVVALKPLHDVAKIKRVVVATYQSVSGAGKEGLDELWNQTKGIFVTDSPTPRKFTKQIAFNVIPHIDVFMDSGETKEEWKMVVETKKILDPKIKLTATCVRVPVFVGHSEAVNIEFEQPISAEEVREILREAPGCMVVDKREDGGYVTPVECVGDFATFISRIREDSTIENGINLWVVSDNLRKGAALNTVQIAECLINRGLLKKAA